jgi:UDP-N-acetylmuramoyl-L-alanyl-D-glutamate--2,6-diaminopimelate ligase
MFAENATAALAAATAAGVPLEAAVNAISSVPAPPGRFEVLNENPLVVLDFAHTPDALARTLDTCRKLERQRTLVVVGAGGERDRTKRPLLGQAASKADIVYATSDNPRSEDPRRIVDEIIEGITELARVRRRPERQVAIEEAIFEARASDIVLVAGRGPETHQATAAGWVPLSDRDVVRESLARRALQSTVTP